MSQRDKQAEDVVRRSFPGEPSCPRPSGGPEARALGGIGEQRPKGRADRRLVTGVVHVPDGVTANLREARDARRQAGRPGPHRLEQRKPEALVQGGVTEDVAQLVEGRQVVVRDEAEGTDVMFPRRALEDVIDLPAPRADENQLPSLLLDVGEPRPGSNETPEVLAGFECTGAQHEVRREAMTATDGGKLLVGAYPTEMGIGGQRDDASPSRGRGEATDEVAPGRFGDADERIRAPEPGADGRSLDQRSPPLWHDLGEERDQVVDDDRMRDT